MRHWKMLGLCLLAALAAMAVVGAGTASATRLCSVNSTPCPSGNTYGKGTAIKAQLAAGTKSVVTSGFVTVECSESTMSGKTTSAGGGSGVAVSGEISSVTWKSCKTSSGETCTASALGTPWPASVTGSGGNGTMTVTNAGGKFSCAVTCEYEAKSASVSATGGNPAFIQANNVSFSKKGGSFLCSSSASWTAKYEVTAPKPLFVVSE
ncbi:MAG TPA: hypothetical protein VF731_11280 [Solirubrobacterales bacterium]